MKLLQRVVARTAEVARSNVGERTGFRRFTLLPYVRLLRITRSYAGRALNGFGRLHCRSSCQGGTVKRRRPNRGFTLLPNVRHLRTKRSFAPRELNGFEGFTLLRSSRRLLRKTFRRLQGQTLANITTSRYSMVSPCCSIRRRPSMSAIGGVSDPHGVWCHFVDGPIAGELC